MARYNTVAATNLTAITTTATISTPNSGVLTEFTGTAPYTVTIPDPTLFYGLTQTFYNNTSGVVTLTTPSGQFKGSGGSGTANLSLSAGSTVSVGSDGVNYVVLGAAGGALNATTGAFSGLVTLSGGLTATTSNAITLSPSGAAVTISPTGGLTVAPTSVVGTIDNVTIGGTTPQTGNFISVNLNTSGILTNNNTLQGSSATTGQSTLFKGGVGIAGTLYTVGLVETSSIAFKENVNPIAGALESILKLTGVTYDRKDTKKHEAGLIAEEVYKHAPDLVALDEKGKPYGIHYTKVSAYLIECIKTLQSEIDELKGNKKTKGRK